jgi:hypothetical protein
MSDTASPRKAGEAMAERTAFPLDVNCVLVVVVVACQYVGTATALSGYPQAGCAK